MTAAQTYEAWRISYQSSEQAARAAFSRMQDLEKEASLWREHVDKLDTLIAYCPTCCQGFAANREMTRDEVIFECGKTSGRAEAIRSSSGGAA